MSGTGYAVAVEGLSALRGIEDIPPNVKRAAAQAVNKTADRGRTSASRRIRRQVAFPAMYLDRAADGRLRVTQRADAENLEARITGRHRPTSLARFTTGGFVGGRNGVRVAVQPGSPRLMQRAFLIRLRAGQASIDTRSNLGLAIRLREGETVENKKRVVQMGNIHLLYGPSVDQVFRTVADDVAPEAAEFLESEFLRLLELGR